MLPEKEKIMVTVVGEGLIKIYYDRNRYNVDPDELKTQAISTQFGGYSTGVEVDRAEFGEITYHYNPVCMSTEQVESGLRRLIDFITSERQ